MDQEKLQEAGLELDGDKAVFQEFFTLPAADLSEAYTATAAPANLPSEIFPLIRAMTSDKVTRNKTRYRAKELKKMVASWLSPYPAPVILNHRDSPDEAGDASEPLGRVVAANYIRNGDSGFLALVPQITDPQGIRKVLDGRYFTVSIGVVAGDVECSICKQKLLTEGFCGHKKGELYEMEDGSHELCVYDPLDMEAREISFVNVPSDNEAAIQTPDMGRQAAMLWAKKAGAVTLLGESSEEHQTTTLREALSGYQFCESFKETIMNENPEATEGLEEQPVEISEEVSEETTESEVSLNTVEEILSAARLLVESAEKGETPNVELTKKVNMAIIHAGLSREHALRVVLSSTEGVPAITREMAPALEGYLTLEENQSDTTIRDYIEMTQKAIADYHEAKNTLTQEKAALETRVAELEASVAEWESKAESVIAGEVERLSEALKDAQAKSHEMLAKTVALEARRQNDPVAKNKSVEALTELFKARTEDSLNDRLNDYLSSYSEETAPPPAAPSLENIEPVPSPAATERQEGVSETSVVTTLARIKELMKDVERTDVPETLEEDEQEIGKVVEDDPEALELFFLKDGTAAIRRANQEAEHKTALDEILDQIKEQSS